MMYSLTRLCISTMSVLSMSGISTVARSQTVWFVDDNGMPDGGCTTWKDACPELQTALDLARAGEQIWVAEGVYRPDFDVETGKHIGLRDISFHLRAGVKVYGGFDGSEHTLRKRARLFDSTILTGDLADNDGPEFADNDENSYHVLNGDGTDTHSLLDGFTITAGFADGAPNVNNGGAGMNNAGANGAFLVVSNCAFVANKAVGGGGAVRNEGPSQPAFIDCIFQSNFATVGGGIDNERSSPLVQGCVFQENTALFGGGGIASHDGGIPMVISCEFLNNQASSGGGMEDAMGMETVVLGSRFVGNTASSYGGAMAINSSATSVSDCLFEGNASGLNGGAVSTDLANYTFTRCVFRVNSAAGTGGAIYNAYSGGLIERCLFESNTTITEEEANVAPSEPLDSWRAISRSGSSLLGDFDGPGGAISNYRTNQDGDELIIKATTFRNNSAETKGGAIYFTDDSLPIVQDSIFVSNTAGTDGGAVHSFDDASPTFARCTFRGNTAEFDGGAIYQESAPAQLLDCAFSENSAERGGALYAFAASETTLNRCTFTANSATQGGAFYHFIGTFPLFTGCTFTANTAALDGGAIYSDDLADLGITRCVFEDNSANQNGGALFNIDESFATIKDSTFRGNTAASGGAHYIENYSNVAYDNCLIQKNHATDSDNGRGGGIVVEFASGFTMTNCVLESNSATGWGGGLYNQAESPTISGCRFTGNMTTASFGGGGALYNDYSNAILDDCTFERNSGAFGGAVWNFQSDPEITSCTFYDNTAELGGGGMANTVASPILINCLFASNRAEPAPASGGALFNDLSSATIINCTFSGNSAAMRGGAIRNIGVGISPSIFNSILWNNKDAFGPLESQQISSGGDVPEVSYSLIQGLDEFTGMGNIDGDPLFVDSDGADGQPGTPGDNFRLSRRSPAIDAGDNTAIPAGIILDLDGNPRFVDDPETKDTGNPDGINPIVDMGAYEYQPQ